MQQVKEINFMVMEKSYHITVKSVGTPKIGDYNLYDCTFRDNATNKESMSTISAWDMNEAVSLSKQACIRINNEPKEKLTKTSLGKVQTAYTKD